MTPEKALTDLHERAEVLAIELKQEVENLEKTLAFPKDYYGLKARAAYLKDKADQLMWIAAKMDAISGLRFPRSVEEQAFPAYGGSPVSMDMEERTEFSVVLLDVPVNNRLDAIKAVRELTGLGLLQAKDLVNETPKTLKEYVPKADAENMKARLERAGCKVELR